MTREPRPGSVTPSDSPLMRQAKVEATYRSIRRLNRMTLIYATFALVVSVATLTFELWRLLH